MGRILRRRIVPPPTALKMEGGFDRESQIRILQHLINNEVKGIFGLGLTGEFPYFKNQEREEIVETFSSVVEEERKLGNDITLVMGVNGDHYGEIYSNAEYLAKFPVIDGLVVQLSHIRDLVDYESLLRNLGEIKEVYIYINPATAFEEEVVTPKNIEKLTSIKNVVGVKISDNFQNLSKYCDALENSDCRVYIGNAIDIFQAADGGLSKEPSGVITGPGNVFPYEWGRAWDIRHENNDERASLFELFMRFDKLNRKIPGGENMVGLIKRGLYDLGIIDSSKCAGENLSKEDQAFVSEALKHIEKQYK